MDMSYRNLSLFFFACLTGFLAVDGFAKCAEAQPIYPEPGSEVPYGGILLQWTDLGSSLYTIDVLSDSGSTTVQSQRPWVSIQAPIDGEQFRWQVSCDGSSSDPFEFVAATILACPEVAPEILAPIAGSTIATSSSLFEWSPVDGAAGYDVYLDDVLQNRNGPIAQTTWQANLAAGEHTLQVMAIGHPECGGEPIPSTTVRFLVEFESTCDPFLSKPEQLTPGPDSSFGDIPLTFEWEPVELATSYELRLIDADTQIEIVAATSIEPGVTHPPDPGVWYWYVVARNDCGETIASSDPLSHLLKISPCPTSSGTLVNPAAGASVPEGNVTFQWNPSGQGPQSLMVGFDGAAATSQASLGSSVGSHTLSLGPGVSVRWFVRTFGEEGCSPKDSTARTFTTIDCPNGPATLSSPANGATVSPGDVTFTWQKVAAAANYEVWLNGKMFGPTTTNGITIPDLPPSTSFDWHVVTKGAAGCPDRTSATFRFTTDSGVVCPGVGATLQSPVNGGEVTAGLVTFNWQGPEGAVAYELLLDGKIVAEGAASTAQIAVGEGTHVWQVRTFGDPSCELGPTLSDEWSFRAVAEPVCPETSPEPTAPLAGATVSAGDVTFSWNAVNGAQTYSLLINEKPAWEGTSTTAVVQLGAGEYSWSVIPRAEGCADGPASNPVRFVVEAQQICPETAPVNQLPANKATLSEGLVQFSWNGVEGATSYQLLLNGQAVWEGAGTTTSITLTEGFYEWWVVALADGCAPSPQSATFGLTVLAASVCPETPVSLVAPADLASFVAGVVEFSWNPVGDATGYQLIINGTVRYEGAAASTKVSLTEGTYEWYVIPIAAECAPGPVEEKRRLSVEQACPSNAPQLVAPVNTEVPSGSVPLSWNDTGADRYEVYLSVDGSAAKLVGETMQTDVTVNLPPQAEVSWYVVALNDGCPPLQSTTARFKTRGCETAAPVAGSPAQGSTVSLPVTFQWSAVTGAVGYRVFAGPVGGAPALVGATTSATSLQTAALPEGELSWFVRALFDGCPSRDSATVQFRVLADASCPDTTPLTLAPEDGSLPGSTTVAFSWTEVDGAEAYRLLASFDGAGFTAIAKTTSTKVTVEVPRGETEWYVEAIVSGCPTLLSNVSRFVIEKLSECPTSVPFLLSPENGATTASPIQFAWSPVTGASGYVLWISVDGQEPQPVAKGTSTSVEVKLAGSRIIWYVEALFSDCPSTFSEKHELTLESISECPSAGASLVAPQDGATGLVSPVAFRWNPVESGAGYLLQLSKDGAAFDTIAKTVETAVEVKLPAGSFQWRVVTLFAGCDPVPSPSRSLTIEQQILCPDETLTLLSPAVGATTANPVTLSWSTVGSAVAYRVWAGVAGSAPSLIARSESTSVQVELPAGEVVWYVEAVRPDCPSVVSGKSRFTVEQASNCSDEAAGLLSPAQGSSNDDVVSFEWSAVSGASSYTVWISSGGEPFQDLATTTETVLTTTLSPGSISWFVESNFAGCPSTVSARGSFFVFAEPECGGTAPVLISPAENAAGVSSPATLIWSDVDEATSYRVWMSRNGGTPVLLKTLPATSLKVPVEPGSYEWYVDAIQPDCPAVRSSSSFFSVDDQGDCPTETALLLSPSSGAIVSDEIVVFSWAPVTGASGYTVWYSQENGTWSSSDLVQTTSLEVELKDGSYRWFVSSHFPGCPTTKTEQSRFEVPVRQECNSDRPRLLSPANESISTADEITFRWSAVDGASEYRVKGLFADGSIELLAISSSTSATVAVTPGSFDWFVEAIHPGCPRTSSLKNSLVIEAERVDCVRPKAPKASVPGNIFSGLDYTVIWKPVSGASAYEVQESGDSTFEESTTTLTEGLSLEFRHEVAAPTPFYYRVRAVGACDGSRGLFSKPVEVVIAAPKDDDDEITNSVEVGDQDIAERSIFIPGDLGSGPFRVVTSVPWLRVEPSEGVLGPDGVTLQLFVSPAGLQIGANTASLEIIFEASGKTASSTHGGTTVPVSVSLVTPISPSTKGAPQPDSLIYPVVARAEGANESFFLSDVRLTNRSASPMRYSLHFTPSGSDATVVGESTEIEVDSGQTIALDDILDSFFGLGTQGESAAGTLEARPLTSSIGTALSPFQTESLRASIGSSRTYNSTQNGTFGQFIPAIPFEEFVGLAATESTPSVISLQQVSQSDAYRTNLGIVEGAGEPAAGVIRAIDNSGLVVATVPFSLKPGEQVQYNSILSSNGVTLEDGRFEVEVTSPTGKITAYASVVDNSTNDPRIVSPMALGSVRAKTYVLPGVADLSNANANWRTDMRLLNAGSETQTATVTFHPQGQPEESSSVELTIEPGETVAVDGVLQSLYGLTNTGGAIRIDTPQTSTLVATARTFNQTSEGTYGQFIPAVTSSAAVGFAESALQVLQIEQSEDFRSNLGLFEVSGAEATVEVAAIIPGSKVSPKLLVGLAPNEFVQLNQVMTQLGLNEVYNGRISVRVVGGSGRVSAYASVVDNETQDPTYIPAQ